jgi:hypothetical protein
VSVGKTAGTNGKTFPEWDGKVYGSALKEFSHFIWAACEFLKRSKYIKF